MMLTTSICGQWCLLESLPLTSVTVTLVKVPQVLLITLNILLSTCWNWLKPCPCPELHILYLLYYYFFFGLLATPPLRKGGVTLGIPIGAHSWHMWTKHVLRFRLVCWVINPLSTASKLHVHVHLCSQLCYNVQRCPGLFKTKMEMC